MKRFKRSDYIEVDGVHSGTSAAFVGINKITGKKGIYKENGCMLGINNEDVREKLASDILTSLGIDCAKIDLVYDETTGQNACFSNYIINDEEVLIDPNIEYDAKSNLNDIDSFVKKYISGVKEITQDKKFINECTENIYKNIYMGCILDSYDLKSDNIPIVNNVRTREKRICAWFDFGTAFKPDAIQKKYFFQSMSSDEVFNELFTKNYDKIKDIANNVKNVLSRENIDKLFSVDYVKESFSNKEFEEIKNRFESQVGKSNLFLEREKNKNKFSSKIKALFDKIFNKKESVKQLDSGENDKFVKKDDNSSFERELSNGVNDENSVISSQIERESNTTQKYIGKIEQYK